MSTPQGDPRVVPVYLLTQGRTRSAGRELPWESVVVTTDAGQAALERLRFEQARIVRLCHRPVAVAEIAADLGVPLGVAGVLVSDLHAAGLLTVHEPASAGARPPREILERLLAGLKQQAGAGGTTT
jgi:hypothetical protein